MRTTFRLFLLVTLLLAGFAFAPAGPARAESPYPPCLEGSPQLTGIFRRWCLWFICVPTVPAWNGVLVIYAHGYESPVDPANWKVPTTPTFANLTNPVDGPICRLYSRARASLLVRRPTGGRAWWLPTAYRMWSPWRKPRAPRWPLTRAHLRGRRV